MIKVLHPGIYSSVQDLGRSGFTKMGIPIAGSMDSYSAEMGNSLLKNEKSDAVIEITDCDPNAFECVINYAMNQPFEITLENVVSIKSICDKYCVSK